MPLSKSALAGIFKRSGGSAQHTSLCADADDSTKRFVEQALLEHRATGEPVAVAKFSDHEWGIVTTRELIVARDHRVAVNPVTEIRKVNPVRYQEGRLTTKDTWDTLEIALSDGRILFLRTDPGEPFSGMWNLLKAFESQTVADREE